MSERAARIMIVVAVVVIAVLAVVIAIVASDGGDQPLAQPAATSRPSDAPSTLPPTTTRPPTTTTTAPAPTTSSFTTSATTTTTSTTTTSTTTTTTTTTAPAVACPGPGTAIPPGSTEVAETSGDYDGDGAIDRFVVYETGGNYFARVELAYGWTSEAPAWGPGGVEARTTNLGGMADIPIAVLIIAPSSSTATFFAMFGCDLDEIPLTDGGTAHFPLEGGFMGKSGVTCTADGITISSAAVAGDMSGDEWEVSGTDYLWVPGLGELQATASSIALIPRAGNEATIDAAAEFNC